VRPDPAIDLDALAESIAARVLHLLRDGEDRLLDLPKLAARLDLSPRGTRGLVARNELPPGYLIGGVRRWSWPSVLKFLESRQQRQRRKPGRGQYARA
jgi:hypothetical protein